MPGGVGGMKALGVYRIFENGVYLGFVFLVAAKSEFEIFNPFGSSEV